MAVHTPIRIPDHLSRVDIGAYMRELRQHYNLSEQDVSERLHIRVRYVMAIENAQFDLMPGKAYARGYVHTYAEFLGLDPDQIVERCFGAEPAYEVQEHTLPESSDWYLRHRRSGGLVVAVMVLGLLAYLAFSGDDTPNEDSSQVTRVEQVPEEYLAGMRTMLMPTAGNYDCLGAPSLLGCYRNQRLTRWTVPAATPDMAPARVDEPPKPAPKSVVAKPAPRPAPKPAPKPIETLPPASLLFQESPPSPPTQVDVEPQQVPAELITSEPPSGGEDEEE